MNKTQEAAAILVERRQRGAQGDRLPESCRPTTLEESLAIQAAVTEQWCEQEDDSIGGWKCLLPPEGKLIVGPIYTRTIDSVAPVSLWSKPGESKIARIEPELAFFFGQDLPPRELPYTPADVDAAISRTHLALELINCRYTDPSQCAFPEMLADGLVNQGLFIGPQVDNELARNANEFPLIVGQNGELSSHNAKHPNSSPRAPLYWLAEFLRSQGQGIVAGQAVITGSFAGVLEVPMNTDITLDYVGLGKMEVSFKAKPPTATPFFKVGCYSPPFFEKGGGWGGICFSGKILCHHPVERKRMNKFTALIALIFATCASSTYAASDSLGTPFKLSTREHSFLEQKVCTTQYGLKASKIKAYAFGERAGGDGKIALKARTSAYVECESHGQFNGKPMRYIDDCDLVDGEWDCSPPQLEVNLTINGRDIKVRPWGELTPEKSYLLLKDISRRGTFQGESLDKAIGDSCDIAKNKDPDIIELGCEAAMTISYWCPQAKTTGCPRVLFLSFDEPAYIRSKYGK